MKTPLSIFWFRRDLRLDDNHGLFEALSGDVPVLPIFIFDTNILDTLDKNDHRVEAIHNQLLSLNKILQEKYNSSLAIYHGKPIDIYRQLAEEYEIQSVSINHDYEPYAKRRDAEVWDFLHSKDIDFFSYKDQVIFEKDDVVKEDGKPYVVYTAYMKRWRLTLNPEEDLYEYNTDIQNFLKNKNLPFLELSDIGFESSGISVPDCNVAPDIIDSYGAKRDFPGLGATSHVGFYLRFGIISIRNLVKKALRSHDDTYLKELIWREFFMQVMWHFPYSATRSFHEKYDYIPWRNNVDEFEKWKHGQTGYPLVDAGMRELNTTGYMHNRVRMIVASFLCKHLLIDWRWGEKYFAEKLFDYELSSNVGNWQWAAGTGVDAAPYFRVFNPEIQMKKFDPKGEYIRKWVPEYFSIGYVLPMVDHKTARERAIETYRNSLNDYLK